MSAAPLPRLAARARGLELSPTVAMSARARALKAEGRRIFDFTVGEPDQDTPPAVVLAAKAALDQGRTRYAPAGGLAELRAAVAERYRQDAGLAVAAEQVVVTVGGKQALALAYQAILERGSEVVVPVPAWPTFVEAARIAGARPRLLPLTARRSYRLTAAAVAAALGPRTRAVVVNSPANPTGAVVEADELVALARLARRRGFWLLFDDAYGRLVYDAAAASGLGAAFAAAEGRLIVLGTASKSYCMTGWRIGWLIGPRGLAEAASALNSHSVQGPATFAQAAAATALRGPQASVRELAAEYRRRRDLVHGFVAELPDVGCPRPQGGFYVFPDVSRCLSRGLPDTVAFCTRLLEETGVAVVPGEGFFAPGRFRLSFATDVGELQEGLRRLAGFVGEQARTRARR